MTNASSASRSALPHWFVSLVGGLTTLTISCIPATTQHGMQVPAQVHGIPNRPELVTVVPFVWKPNETDDERANVAIPAEVDGHRGVFILDLGSVWFELNRTYLQPNPNGGADTITEANRIPERDTAASTYVHITTVRIGTLISRFEDPALKAPSGRPANALLNHMWKNFTVGGFVPQLGAIGPTVLEPFETIIDYRHQQVVLIQLDSAGHRLVDVPAYTPVWSAPLLDIQLGQDWGKHAASSWWGVEALLGGVPDTLIIDSGTQDNRITAKTAKQIAAYKAKNNNQYSLMIADRTFKHVHLQEHLLQDINILGYTFLRSLGVVGFNHRTHQILLYR
jgi:hypothetical protein